MCCTGLMPPSGPSSALLLLPTHPQASVRAPIACERGFTPAKLTGSLCQEQPPGPTHVLIRIDPSCSPPLKCFPIVKNLIVFLFLFSVKYTFHYLPLLYHLIRTKLVGKIAEVAACLLQATLLNPEKQCLHQIIISDLKGI